MRLPHLKIGQRLGFGYGFVIVLLIAMTLVGVARLGALSRTTDQALRDRYPNTVLVNEVIFELGAIARAMRNTLIMSGPDQVKAQLADIARAKLRVTALMNQLTLNVRDPAGVELLQQIEIIRSAYTFNQEEFIALLGEGRLGEAKNLLLVDLDPYQGDYFRALEKLQQHESALMEQARRDIEASYQRARAGMLALSGFAALLSIVITFGITRSLLRQLGGEPDYATAIARQIAAGQMDIEIAIAPRDRTSLLYAMKVMRDRLEERSFALQEANAELEQSLESLKMTQDDLVRSEKLAALGALVAGVAHELNTPIGNGLLAASSLADHLRNFEAEVAAGLRKSSLDAHLAEVNQAAEIMLRNLNRAVDLVASFKQVAVDRASSQGREFLLDEVVTEIMLTLWPSLKKSGVAITHDIPPGIRMRSYPGALGQVVTNLINNAVIHGFDGATDCGCVSLRARVRDDGWVELEVRDDGAGIAPEHLGRIYDPFFTTKLGKGGSGLGLNIVYNLVRGVLDGRIAVRSAVGKGTVFTVTLPLDAIHG
ncbi:MAG TPA: ATP-binding protein [Burkholderiaceae bacterium]|nr:ATP-binding protein [Burkholderiaceae bacterium]